MRKLYYLCLALLFPSLIIAQPFIPNGYFQEVHSQPCAWDTNQTVFAYDEWEFYQTLNDSWDGPIDIASCISLDSITYQARLSLNQIDTSRALFIRAKFDSTGLALEDNNLYYLFYDLYGSNGVNFNLGNSCANGLCSGVMAGIRIPDSAGTGTAMRWYEASLFENPDYNFGGYGFCIPSEYFVDGNYLAELIIKIEIASYDHSSDKLFINNVRLEDMWPFLDKVYPTTNLAGYYYQNAYNFYGNYGNIYMFMHDTTYPSPNNVTYYDFSPIPNVTDSQMIDIYFGYDMSIIFQPYTQFRGGLVLNDSVKRHAINLHVDNDTVCIYPFYDVFVEHGNHLTFHSGAIRFEGKASCIMLGKQGVLSIADNSTLKYGSENNAGILALRTGANIDIGRNSELVIHNNVIMFEYGSTDGPQQIYMTLNEGSKLTFARGSSLTNLNSLNKNMKLNIYMKGGVLDDSGLSDKDKLLINRIYDSPLEELKDNLVVYENPFREKLHYSIVGEAGQSINTTLYDVNGKLVFSKLEEVPQQGINFFNTYVPELNQGVYLLNVETKGSSVFRKLVKF